MHHCLHIRFYVQILKKELEINNERRAHSKVSYYCLVLFILCMLFSLVLNDDVNT